MKKLEASGCKFYHHAQSYRAYVRTIKMITLDLQASMTTTAKIARKHCPKTVRGYKYFHEYYEINVEKTNDTKKFETNFSMKKNDS